MIPPDMTIAELQKLGALNPSIARLASFLTVSSYPDFVTQLNKDIDESVNQIQESRQLHQEDGEDRLTSQIVSNLNILGYAASHDTAHGGHVDLLVKYQGYKWLGESKIHSSYDYLFQGFQQLNTRYSTGSPEENCGGMIIFIKVADSLSVMTRWEEHLKEKNVDELTVSACPQKQLAFLSYHKHQVSGTNFCTRHIPVLLHFNPQDRKT